MPAVSKAQQSYMAGCKHNPRHMKGKCPDEETSREFARTPRKGLPEKKRRKPSVSYPKR